MAWKDRERSQETLTLQVTAACMQGRLRHAACEEEFLSEAAKICSQNYVLFWVGILQNRMPSAGKGHQIPSRIGFKRQAVQSCQLHKTTWGQSGGWIGLDSGLGLYLLCFVVCLLPILLCSLTRTGNNVLRDKKDLLLLLLLQGAQR